jgi:hypothetical protein
VEENSPHHYEKVAVYKLKKPIWLISLAIFSLIKYLFTGWVGWQGKCAFFITFKAI